MSHSFHNRLDRLLKHEKTGHARCSLFCFIPQLEELEDRTVLSPVPLTAHEQFFLELQNRARANPTAEATRLGIALNEGLPPGTISTAPKPPLAPNLNLLAAIRSHLQDMLANNFFSHNSSNGTTFDARIANFGYAGATTLGENLAWRPASGTPNLTQFVELLYNDLFIDATTAGRGHRVAILNPAFKEAGPGVAAGLFGQPLLNAVLVGTDFGARTGNSFLTGVVYNDSAVLQNNFYTPGEGVGGATVTAVSTTGAVFADTTGPAGGYQLQLPPGTYTVTVSGAGIPNPLVSSVTIGAANAKVDFPNAVTIVSPNILVTAANVGSPVVQIFDAQTRAERFRFFAYDPAFGGGVRVATADMNGDGFSDVITAAGPGGGPHVRIFDGRTSAPMGGPLGSFFPYAPGFTGGVFVAAGDVNGDGHADIITAAGGGGGPHVRVFDGVTGLPFRDFFAYGAAFTGGVRIATADVNGDGQADIITAPGPGGGPHVRIFDGGTNAEIASFFAYAPTFTGGVFVTAGDINADGRVEIITAAGAGGGPHVRILDGLTQVERGSFFAYSPAFIGGVRVGVVDRNNDGRLDIITAPGPGGGPHVRVIDGFTLTDIDSFFATDPTFTLGLFVAGP